MDTERNHGRRVSTIIRILYVVGLLEERRCARCIQNINSWRSGFNQSLEISQNENAGIVKIPQIPIRDNMLALLLAEQSAMEQISA